MRQRKERKKERKGGTTQSPKWKLRKISVLSLASNNGNPHKKSPFTIVLWTDYLWRLLLFYLNRLWWWWWWWCVHLSAFTYLNLTCNVFFPICLSISSISLHQATRPNHCDVGFTFSLPLSRCRPSFALFRSDGNDLFGVCGQCKRELVVYFHFIAFIIA